MHIFKVPGRHLRGGGAVAIHRWVARGASTNQEAMDVKAFLQPEFAKIHRFARQFSFFWFVMTLGKRPASNTLLLTISMSNVKVVFLVPPFLEEHGRIGYMGHPVTEVP